MFEPHDTKRLPHKPMERREGFHYVRLVGRLEVDAVKAWCEECNVEYPSRQTFLHVPEENKFARFLIFKDEKSAALFRLRWF